MKIAIAIISILAVALIIAYRWRPKETEINSFWDVVRNPDSMPDLDEFHKHVEETAASLSGSAPEIAKLVDFFVFEAKSSRDAWTEKRIIAKLGKEAYVRALEILRDPSVHDRLVLLTEVEHSLPEAPICRLCEIFDQNEPPPQEAASLLAPFLHSDSNEIRKSVALVIGSIGSESSVANIQGALADKEEYVRSFALMGLQRAVLGGRITQASKAEFFEIVAGMWPADTSFAVCDDIPKLLLDLDRNRAIEYLLSPDLCNVKFKPVWRILQAFESKQILVPRSKLLTLIDDAKKEPIAYPMDSILEGALSLLGRHQNQEDLPMLERLANYPNDDVSNGAIQGLYSYHRYFDEIRDPRAVIETSGWDALTETEKHLCAIEELDGEISNGGFAQYYFNSSGNEWQEALNGLAAIGAKKRHAILMATINKFGKTPPSADRDERTSQLSKIVRRQEDPFSEQDTAWYKTEDEPLVRLMFHYNLANQEGRQKAAPNGTH